MHLARLSKIEGNAESQRAAYFVERYARVHNIKTEDKM